jgi:hypothetical protein
MTTQKQQNGKLGFVYRLWTSVKSVESLVGKFYNSHLYLQLAQTIVMINSSIAYPLKDTPNHIFSEYAHHEVDSLL